VKVEVHVVGNMACSAPRPPHTSATALSDHKSVRFISASLIVSLVASFLSADHSTSCRQPTIPFLPRSPHRGAQDPYSPPSVTLLYRYRQLSLTSAGTVLIDVFETTPLLTPSISFITPTNPTFTSPDAPQSHPVVPPVPTFDLLPPLEFPISNTALLTTPESSTSGTSTPQLPFDSSQTLSSTPSHELLGGGALYNLVGARIWLLPSELRTLVDRAPGGTDLSAKFEENLNSFGPEMWVWNEFEGSRMTRSRIAYENGSRR